MLIHFVLTKAALMLRQQSEVVVTETVRPAKPTIFTTWSFTEEACCVPLVP